MWDRFWELRVNDRLTRWRQFREELDQLTLQEALEVVNKSWNRAPFINYYLDETDPKTWPDPWTLLAENQYCSLARALGMLYTLYFTKHSKSELQLLVYYDLKEKDRYHVVSVKNGEYILNCWPQELVNTKHFEKKQFKLLYQYSIKDLKIDRY